MCNNLFTLLTPQIYKIMVTYKITYLDVTHNRRVSFSDAIGVKESYMPLDMFIASIAIIAKYPLDYPCVQITTRSGKLKIKSNVIFTAPCVSRS